MSANSLSCCEAKEILWCYLFMEQLKLSGFGNSVGVLNQCLRKGRDMEGSDFGSLDKRRHKWWA